jgi:hypothetical protein
MTQKRYIKLLMSHGVPRDIARKFVDDVKRTNRLRMEVNHIAKWTCEFLRVNLLSYSELYSVFLTDKDVIKSAWGLK